MAREKTNLRHITNDGQKIRVTKEGDALYIGNTNERAEGKVISAKTLGFNNGKLPRPYRRHYKPPQDEWGDFAYTSDDL